VRSAAGQSVGWSVGQRGQSVSEVSRSVRSAAGQSVGRSVGQWGQSVSEVSSWSVSRSVRRSVGSVRSVSGQ